METETKKEETFAEVMSIAKECPMVCPESGILDRLEQAHEREISEQIKRDDAFLDSVREENIIDSFAFALGTIEWIVSQINIDVETRNLVLKNVYDEFEYQINEWCWHNKKCREYISKVVSENVSHTHVVGIAAYQKIYRWLMYGGCGSNAYCNDIFIRKLEKEEEKNDKDL